MITELPIPLWRPLIGSSNQPRSVPTVSTRWLLETYKFVFKKQILSKIWQFCNFDSHLSISGRETPMSPDVIHTPGVTKKVSPETTNQTLKSIKFWCVGKGNTGRPLVLKGLKWVVCNIDLSANLQQS